MPDKYSELDFERDLCDVLAQQGWRDGLLSNLPVHRDGEYDKSNIRSLEENFRDILDKNNIKELNGVLLSDSEFARVMDEIKFKADTPVKANIMLNGGRIQIDRDPDSPDKAHAGLPVYLDIFSHQDIGTGDSVYQIAHQVRFATGKHVKDRRGDVTLLINGLPVIHLELKTEKAGILEAQNQIQKYLSEGVFTGLMGFVQVFFAMTPEDAVYFANYGVPSARNDAFVFRWASAPFRDQPSELIKNWRVLAGQNGKDRNVAMLSIPEAHQFVGCYTVAEVRSDPETGLKGPEQVANGVLKVLRYYQYHAVDAILKRVVRQHWGDVDPLGGICWCTTGGGKTLSSFKAGEAIIDRNLADKVIFLVDRTELDNQSLTEYNSFAREGRPVSDTRNSHDLFKKLKSDAAKDAMVITSIQKMDRIVKEPPERRRADLDKIRSKRIVFIVDEAQRSQFGDMHGRVKDVFPTALYFGFTGTPIMGGLDAAGTDDTRKVFGDYISVYTISDGIRDGNVLGFAPKGCLEWRDGELADAVARRQTGCASIEDARRDPKTEKAYMRILRLKMPASYEENGKQAKGVEGYLSAADYDTDAHRRSVVQAIRDEWPVVSQDGPYRLHGMLSAASVDEVIAYYDLFSELRENGWDIKFTALFDTHDRNDAGAASRSDAVKRILDDYEALYGQSFEPDEKGVRAFKKDVMDRLAHKGTYKNIEAQDMLDIVIVCDQLLVGYDSKYLSVLFLDRELESHKLIQAISRTNRVLDQAHKPFGQVRFFRKPHTMKITLDEALRLYCQGDNSCAQAPDIKACLDGANGAFGRIREIFSADGIKNFVRLPADNAARMKFRAEFRMVRDYLNMARLQGCVDIRQSGGMLKWDAESDTGKALDFMPDEYEVLHMRYLDTSGKGPETVSARAALSVGTSLSDLQMERIDLDYLEKHFGQIAPRLAGFDDPEEEKDNLVEGLKADFGKLTEYQQRHAEMVLEDIRNGGLEYIVGKLFREYIREHIDAARHAAVGLIAERYGLDSDALERLCRREPDETSLNDGMEFNKLSGGIDVGKAGTYYGTSGFPAKRQAYEDLKKFVLEGWREA